MEFQRGREAIAEGRACVERANLSLRKYFPELAAEPQSVKGN
jgi:hypothetical protein